MSRLQSLKGFIYQRLTAAVEEIIGHFERTVTEYEEEVECRHRKLLDMVSKPENRLQRAGLYNNMFLLLPVPTKLFIHSLLALANLAPAKVARDA